MRELKTWLPPSCAHAGVRCGVGGHARSRRMSGGKTRPSPAVALSFTDRSARALEDLTVSKADISGIGLRRLFWVAVEDSEEEDMDEDPSSFCCDLCFVAKYDEWEGDDMVVLGRNRFPNKFAADEEAVEELFPIC